MNLALVATGYSPQDKDLIREAQKKGHQLTILRPRRFILPPKKEENKWRQFDLIYWRVSGSVPLREVISRYLYQEKIPLINSGYFKNPLLREKGYQLYLAQENKILIPKTLLINKGIKFEEIIKELGQPFIIKKNVSSCGHAVWLIKNKEELEKVITQNRLNYFLAQQFLKNNGDYRVLVIGGKALGIMKRVPKKNQFKANISLGGHGERVGDTKLKKRLSSLAEKICQILSLEIAGIDFIKNKDKVYFIESNSSPQWQGFQKTTKVNVAGKIFDYFEKKIAKLEA